MPQQGDDVHNPSPTHHQPITSDFLLPYFTLIFLLYFQSYIIIIIIIIIEVMEVMG